MKVLVGLGVLAVTGVLSWVVGVVVYRVFQDKWEWTKPVTIAIGLLVLVILVEAIAMCYIIGDIVLEL